MMLQNAQAEFIETMLAQDERTLLVSPAANLAIYRNNIYSTLMRALKETYPLTLALLGKDFFAMAAREYMRQYPSRSGNLHDYGGYFSDFLATYKPVHELIYLTEVAEFEWAYNSIYHAPNHPPFAAHTLTSFPPEQHEKLHFILHPASWLHKFHYPILKIRDLCLEHHQENIDLKRGGVNLLMIRKELEIKFVSLSSADFAFLEALQHDLNLSDALHAAESHDSNYPLDERLPRFILENIIVGCYVMDEVTQEV